MSRREPKVGFKTITPAEAKKFLAESKRANRPPVPGKVRTYAARMKAGTWNPHNSTAISRDWDGDLVNGHNRLLACIEADTPFTTLFMDGVDPATFADEDTGATRNMSDFIGIKATIGNRAKASMIAAGARALEMFDRGLWKYAATSGLVRQMSDTLVTNDQLWAACERHPDVFKAADWLRARQRLIGAKMRMGLLCGFWAITRGHKAHSPFWGELVDGIEVGTKSPVRLLRNRIDAAQVGGHRLQATMFLALLTKTWNAYADNTHMDRLMWMKAKGETLPSPVTRLKPAHPVQAATEPPVAEAA